MRRNSNYFGDVSQFFLKAKKEENFVLNPEVKNSIREKLSLKIAEIKNPVLEQQKTPEQKAGQNTANIIYEASEELPKANFWTLWKRQLISVPASLFALTMIVFAANNFQFTLQTKEEAPSMTEKTSDLATSLLDTKIPDEKAEDEPVISDAEKTEPEEKPELLVLDFGETRTLNKNQSAVQTETSKTENSSANTNSTQTTDTVKTDASSDNNQQETQQNTGTTSTQTANQETADTGTSDLPYDIGGSIVEEQITAQEQITAPVQTDAPVIELNKEQIAENVLITDDALIKTEDAAEAPVINAVINKEVVIAPVNLSDQIKSANIFVQTDRNKLFSVNYYKAASLKQDPAFNKTILSDITANKSPSAVNVYYISGSQVVIEISDSTTKYLYLYELKDGVWTVVKYEKSKL